MELRWESGVFAFFEACRGLVDPVRGGCRLSAFSLGKEGLDWYLGDMPRDELFPSSPEPEAAGAGVNAERAFCHQPLAARMRPRDLNEFVGQAHILGPGQLLRRAIEADRIQSLIF